MSNTPTLADLRAQMFALKQQMREAGTALFQEASQALFAAHPMLVAFGWRQYTPYFNDGDPCTFRATTDYVDVWYTDPSTGNVEHTDETDRWSIKYRLKENKVRPIDAEVVPAIQALLEQFDDEQYHDLFGDHSQVRIDRSGVTVSDYVDHD